MSEVEKEFADYIEDQTIATLATDLFVSLHPSKAPDNCIIVYNTGGGQPDSYIPTLNPTIQIFVRNKDYEAGKAKILAIQNALHRKANLNLIPSGKYYYYIRLIQNPIHLGQDESNRHEWSMNFETLHRN